MIFFLRTHESCMKSSSRQHHVIDAVCIALGFCCLQELNMHHLSFVMASMRRGLPFEFSFFSELRSYLGYQYYILEGRPSTTGKKMYGLNYLFLMLVGKCTVTWVYDIPFLFCCSTYCVHSHAAAEEGDLHFKKSKLELSKDWYGELWD